MELAEKLRKAIIKRDLQVIRQLADYAHIPLKKTYKTPFQLAVELRSIDAILTFIKAGVSLNWFDWRNKEAVKALYEMGILLPTETPLHTAARRCDADIVSLLLRHGADPNALDKNGHTPLYYAVLYGCKDVIRSLLEHGAKYGDVVFSDDPEVVELLLRYGAARYPADLGIICRNQRLLDYVRDINEDDAVRLANCGLYEKVKHRIRSPKLLPFAVRRNDVEYIRELPPANAGDIVNILLEEYPSREVAALLVKRLLEVATPKEAESILLKYNVFIDDEPPGDALLKFLLVHAVESGKIGLLKHLLTFVTMPYDIICHVMHEEVLQILLDKGAPLNASCLPQLIQRLNVKRLFRILRRHVAPDELLRAAVAAGNWEAAVEALQLGADPRVSYDGMPVICYAVDDAPADAVKLLLRRGADPNVNCDGKMPLHIAAKRCRPDVADLLLRHNADPLADSEEGTPVEVACNAVRDVILSYLPSFSQLTMRVEINKCKGSIHFPDTIS